MKRFSYKGSFIGKISVSLAIHVFAIGLIVTLMLMGTAMGDISRTGLVAEWHFEGDAKDSSGNGIDGTSYGATFVDGKFGKALALNGINNYVDFGTGGGKLDFGTGDFSIEFWMNYSGTTVHPNVTNIMGKTIGTDNSPGFMAWTTTWGGDGTNYGLFIATSTGPWHSGNVEDWGKYFPNSWYHVVFVRKGNTWIIYKNGEYSTSGTNTDISLDVNNAASFKIGDSGARPQTPLPYFNGLIDEVRIYNRALSANEVKANYEAGQIIVTSSPPGAEVLINNQSKGNASPTLTVAGISPGSYAVRCKLSGYLDYDSNAVLTAGSVASINCAPKISTPTATPTPTTPIPTTSAPTTTPTLTPTTPAPTTTTNVTPTLTPTPTPTTPITALITGNVMDAQTDKPLRDATITIDGNSTITGSDGEYQLVVSSGNHNITVNKSGYEIRTMSVNVSVAGTVDLSIKQIPPPTPLWSILILVIILVLAAITLYLWTKGNLQLIPKQTSLPCDGKSTLPIKVQFVNTFGKPKKQGKDREIEMETTSGKIQNVVIPAGKESAEATLISSNESGAVTITAKSGKQKATTQVNFVCEETRIEVDVSSAAIPADGSSTATVTIKVKDATGKYVTALNERTVELTTTLGTITSPVTIPPKTLAGIAIITSGQVSGTAIIKASIGPLKGEGKVVFAELPKKFCMHCGAPMAIQPKSCPVCGNVPPSGVDTKQCSTCGAILPLTAKFCDKCGARQPI